MHRAKAGELAVVFLALTLAGVSPAGAIVKGSESTLGRHTVRLVGNGYCTGVAVSRRLVVTAAHCAEGMRVLAGGLSYKVIAIRRDAVLDDGRNVTVSGDAAILKLGAQLPASIEPATVGEGSGDTFTIAGYGTVDERRGTAFGALHEAKLALAKSQTLFDPARSGPIGASACFGDSGGPVMRGGVLVGIVTRAANPSPRVACGMFTRWAPIRIGSPVAVVTSTEAPPEQPVNTDAEPEKTPPAVASTEISLPTEPPPETAAAADLTSEIPPLPRSRAAAIRTSKKVATPASAPLPTVDVANIGI